MHTGKRLKYLREKLELSQTNFAEAIRCNEGVIKRIELEKQKKISAEIVERIRTKFGCNPAWLITGEGEVFLSNIISAPKCYYSIPKLTSLASAGNGSLVQFSIINDYFQISSEFIDNYLKANPENLYFFNVVGDSMEPTLKDGDIILVDSSVECLKDNLVYVIQLGEELLVKRSYRQDETTYLFVSDNDKIYQPKLISTSLNFKIIGLVKCKLGLVR
jgi:SOS-response transcriptional repressor LexA